jgi:hypothetical protein
VRSLCRLLKEALGSAAVPLKTNRQENVHRQAPTKHWNNNRSSGHITTNSRSNDLNPRYKNSQRPTDTGQYAYQHQVNSRFNDQNGPRNHGTNTNYNDSHSFYDCSEYYDQQYNARYRNENNNYDRSSPVFYNSADVFRNQNNNADHYRNENNAQNGRSLPVYASKGDNTRDNYQQSGHPMGSNYNQDYPSLYRPQNPTSGPNWFPNQRFH